MNKRQEESDSILIAQAKEDPEAFGLLYERYVDRIYNYVYYRTSNHHVAEDLTARTFYKVLKHISRYEDRGIPFSAYLHRVAHNLLANWHRDRNRHKLISFEGLKITAGDLSKPDTVTEKKGEEERLLEIVQRLPADRQQVLILKHVEQMTNAEIGEVIGRTEGAVKSLYHRTLLTLREELADERK
ncbi:MAG TPA: sigma-70 family RNA polymerase sigma factor [Chloroflexi bacterium]|nr:sigma-70 family RNA polymerase sigma factor [Chloroflexota bacterium]